MKNFHIAILAALLILNLAGCNTDISGEYPWSVTKTNVDTTSENADIKLQLVDGTLTSKGAELVLYNNSNMAISFGADYFIQLQRDNSWYDIEIESLDWTAILLTVESDSEYTFEVDWSSIYGELPSGTYKLIKEYAQEQQVLFISVEFEIS